MRHVFLINPHAGKQDQTARIRALADRLAAAHNLDCRCLLTDRPGGAEVLSRALAETGEPVRIYACGGDGTVHEAANGIAGFPNAAMTVIPAGTGNDFLKNFGPDAAKFSDPEHLWDGPEFPLDLIDCNGRLCLTIACSGIDARIADTVHRYGNVPGLSGRGSYLLSVAVNFLFKPIGRRWRVELDGEVLEDDFALVSMCNGRYYGGGSMPVPEARSAGDHPGEKRAEAHLRPVVPGLLRRGVLEISPHRPNGDVPAGGDHRQPRGGGHRHLSGRGEPPEPGGAAGTRGEAGELLRAEGVQSQCHGEV